MAKESFIESFKHFVGVEDARTKKKHQAAKHWEQGEDAAMEAAYNMYLLMRDGVGLATDVAGEQLSKAGHFSAEQLARFAEYSKQKAAEGYELSKEKAAEGLEFSKEKLGEGFEYSKEKAAEAAEIARQRAAEAAELAREKAAQGYELGKEKAAEAADYSAEKLADGYEYSKEKLGEGLEYSKERAAEAAEIARQRAAEGLQYSKERAADGYEYSAEKLADGYDYSAEKLAEGADAAKDNLKYAHRKIAETISELPAQAGQTVVNFRDEAGNTWERIKGESGDYYERIVGEPIAEGTETAKGMFGKLGDGLSHLGHNINSMFHATEHEGRKAAHDAARGAESNYEYVKDSVGDYVLRAKQSVDGAAGKAQASWDDLYSSKDWQSYFKANPKLDEAWWRQYFSASNFSPSASHWKEYIPSFMGGPSKLDQFWRKAEKSGHAARDSVRGKYHQVAPTKRQASSWFGSAKDKAASVDVNKPWLGLGSNQSGGQGQLNSIDAAPVAPVGLFWSAILALYLLFLAKRIFEQKRAQHVRATGPSPTPSTINGKDVGYSEKVNLSSVAQANSDSLSTFAIYAPATTVLLLAHELNNAVPALALHGIYTAMFAGQFLQNETSLVHDPKARGLGVYLSWGAAGVAGVAGVLVSLGQVF